MRRYVCEFFRCGLIFGGFGPVVMGIVYLILSCTIEGFTLTGGEVCLAIISTYLLAFIQAGASVFNRIDHWPLARSLGTHFLTLFAAYSMCYVVNTWIPFEPLVLLIFAAAFTLTYAIIVLVVYLAIRATSKKMNSRVDIDK